MKKSIILTLIALLFAACSTQSNSGKTKLHVVATTGMLYDAVINIAGNKMSAEAIMGPGVDPH
ncbi:MAG: manganese transporter, partial [Ekhidna sp.]|nr:manganese transporter [Ekhidna sp.]